MSALILNQRRLDNLLGASLVRADVLALELAGDLETLEAAHIANAAAIVAADVAHAAALEAANVAAAAALVAVQNSRPLYNMADSGVTYSPKASPVDMSAALAQAITDAGDRQLYLPGAAGAESPNIHISTPFAPIFGIVGEGSDQNAGVVRSNISAISGGFTGAGVFSPHLLRSAPGLQSVMFDGSSAGVSAMAWNVPSTFGNAERCTLAGVLFRGGGNTPVIDFVTNSAIHDQFQNSTWLSTQILGSGGGRLIDTSLTAHMVGTTMFETWFSIGANHNVLNGPMIKAIGANMTLINT